MYQSNKTVKTIIEELRSRKTYLKTAEVMEIIRIGRQTLCKWVRQGKIAALRIGKDYQFDPRIVAAWLEARTV